MSDDSETRREGADGVLGPDELTTFVQSLITMMRSGNLQRLDLEYRDLRVALRSGQETEYAPAGSVSQGAIAAAPAAPAPAVADDTYLVSAPMIGTFYAAPAPNEPPFVQPGDRVEEGQTIGIIEAMKIMNEIAADRSGTVVEVIARNAQAVEYGSPLVRLRPDGL
ncbi:MAG TPA: acetyl-CoA carboxylase biotin carboxyl carrier protein [Thermomicrobiales bacterium]|nr:acetyl-CoA carboxylase biotin carboxyl carrier protein [Thermomicrobiales bacterium]